MKGRMERSTTSHAATATKVMPVIVAFVLVFVGNYFIILGPTSSRTTQDGTNLAVVAASRENIVGADNDYPVAHGSVLEFHFDGVWQPGTVTSTQSQTFATILSNGTIVDGVAKREFKTAWRLPCMGNKPGDVSLARTSLPDGPKTSPLPKLSDHFLDRFIVIPEYKLLFCYVEKVCTRQCNERFGAHHLVPGGMFHVQSCFSVSQVDAS